LEKLIFNPQRIDKSWLTLRLGQHLWSVCFILLGAQRSLNLELRHARPASRQHGLVSIDRGALLVSLLQDLREALIFGFLWCWPNLLLHVEQVLAERIDSIWTTFKASNLGDVPKFSLSSTIFIVLNVLIRVNRFNHFFFLAVLKFILTCWIERYRISLGIEITKFVLIFFMVFVNTQQVS
jgi:hypothetical protein